MLYAVLFIGVKISTMQKQFEIIERLYSASKESETRIKELRDAIEAEFSKLKGMLLSAYNNDADTMYLVQFHSYSLFFFKATKDVLNEVKINWYESNQKLVREPKNYDEAKNILENYAKPTNCEILSYRTFGYFHDIQRSWDRIDFIAEETHQKKFLFEITEEQFLSAIKCVAQFYGVPQHSI